MVDLKTSIWIILAAAYGVMAAHIRYRASSSVAANEGSSFGLMLKVMAIGLVVLFAVSKSIYLSAIQLPFVLVLLYLLRRRIRITADAIVFTSGIDQKVIIFDDIISTSVEFDESEKPASVSKFSLDTRSHGEVSLVNFSLGKNFMLRLESLLNISEEDARKIYSYKKVDFNLAIIGCLSLAAINICFAISRASGKL
jgi:hypothetical protein